MADIVNLRQARKARTRNEKQKDADASRTAHGRSKAEKSLTKARGEKAVRDLEAHKREKPDGES